MKTSLISRLSLLAVVFGLSISVASAQPTIYTEDAKQPGMGYWTIETDAAHHDYSIVRFYTASHEKIYEERLDELCLDPSKGTTACRRTARMLNSALVQVQRTRNTSMISNGLGLNRRVQRTYATR
ncbi:hypothetical protein [Hymenobacter chitinivorans]|uniref:Uncharacterized protein n=1 Tax=Hymenobacter chitinivorans DSM 11115 TaxID=1121954 RepID=A0A2M9BPS5_9BACT|nr:hypothetical protein [Hymenobacter chitinivorans]PJJ59961.1 hypothetical protein CLV45_1383 [Hymenobacter chitinivorans DSM 11115]